MFMGDTEDLGVCNQTWMEGRHEGRCDRAFLCRVWHSTRCEGNCVKVTYGEGKPCQKVQIHAINQRNTISVRDFTGRSRIT